LPRIDLLRNTPAKVRFLSIEPLLEDLGGIDLRGIHWAIVGGESRPGARPIQAEWVVSIQKQCENAGVPFFFKQWGGVRKKQAGRLLAGRTWKRITGAANTVVDSSAVYANFGRGIRTSSQQLYLANESCRLYAKDV